MRSAPAQHPFRLGVAILATAVACGTDPEDPTSRPDLPHGGSRPLPVGSSGSVERPPAVPAVVRTAPAHGERGVSPEAPIRVVFSVAMDRDRTEGAVRVDPPADAVWIDDATLDLVPRVGRPSGSVAELWVGTGATDVSGRSLVEPAWVRFETADVLAPAVLDARPAVGAEGVALDAPARVVFSEPIARATVSVVPATSGVATWSDDGRTLVWQPDAWAPHTGHTVSVEVADAAGNVSVTSLAFHTEVRDRLPAVAPSGDGQGWTFTEVASAAGLDHVLRLDAGRGAVGYRAGGIASGDVDGDGWPDVVAVTGDGARSLLYRNRGDGTFEEIGAWAGVALPGVAAITPALADLDGDGALDLMIASFTGTTVLLGAGDGSFDALPGAIDNPYTTFSITLGDPDGDGDLDAFTTHRDLTGVMPADPRFLWNNDGTGRFTDVTRAAGLYGVDLPFTYTANFTDFDDDGIVDLLVAGDVGTSRVLRGLGGGTFAVHPAGALDDEAGMGAALGDYDHDGDLDWFVTSISTRGWVTTPWTRTGNRLYRNDGGTFTDVSAAAGVRESGWAWGTCFADADLDGHPDLFVTNGWPAGAPYWSFHRDVNTLFVANGDGTFTDRAPAVGLDGPENGRGVVCFDYDRDGDVDFLVAAWGDRPRLYRNDLPPGRHFLSVRLVGRGPNTEAIGARVWLTAGGATQLRELRAGSHFASQDPVEAHFGLGPVERVDLLRVEWPDGAVTEVGGIAADRFVVIEAP